jgi:hypothetical protein
MFGYDWPRLHAALNDLPAALLLVTVLFDTGAWITKRESLAQRPCGRSGPVSSAGGGGGRGLPRMRSITVRRFTTSWSRTKRGRSWYECLYGRAGWLPFRRGHLSCTAELLSRGLSLAGLVTLIYTARLGARCFRARGRVPTVIGA